MLGSRPSAGVVVGGIGNGFSGLLASIVSLSLCSQEKVRAVFDNLIQLEHLNIVKFHKYWADVKENKARVSFVLECPELTARDQLHELFPLPSDINTDSFERELVSAVVTVAEGLHLMPVPFVWSWVGQK